jgi:hypothetical protein
MAIRCIIAFDGRVLKGEGVGPTLEGVAAEGNGVHHRDSAGLEPRQSGAPAEAIRLFGIIPGGDYTLAAAQPVPLSNFCGSFLQTKA